MDSSASTSQREDTQPKLWGRPLAVVATAVLAANVALVWAAPEVEGGAMRYGLASLMLWVSAYPSLRFFAERRREIPFIPVMAIVYFMHYGLAAFHKPMVLGHLRVDGSQIEAALLLALIGEVLLLLAFYKFPSRGSWSRLDPPVDLRRNANKLLFLAMVLEAARSQLVFVGVDPTLEQLLAFFNFLPVVLAGALLLLRLRGELGLLQTVPAVLVLVCHVLIDFTTGSMAPAAFTLVTVLFLYVAERGRVPVLAVTVASLVLMVGLGTKMTYRQAVKKSTASSAEDRLHVLSDVMVAAFTTGEVEKSGEIAKNRMDHLSAFAFVMARTPDPIPYWGGETYETALFSLVPRMLYPDKPTKTLGQAYGHRYGFIGPRDRGTSINLEQTVELFVNFGVPGVIVGMLLFGVIYRLLYSLLNRPSTGDGGLLVAAGTFRILLNIESDFSLVFGGVLQTAVLLYLVLYVLARPAPSASYAASTSASTGSSWCS